MQLLKKSLRAVLLLGLVGCSTTGGELGGLVPAPKFTKGTLADGQYTAQDNSFSVKSPFDKGSNEYTYMKIEEHYSDTENHIVFSSSAASAEAGEPRAPMEMDRHSSQRHHKWWRGGVRQNA